MAFGVVRGELDGPLVGALGFLTTPCGSAEIGACRMERAVSIKVIGQRSELFLGFGERAVGGDGLAIAYADRRCSGRGLQRIGRDVVTTLPNRRRKGAVFLELPAFFGLVE